MTNPLQNSELSPPQNWTHSLHPSLSIYANFFHEISLCFAWWSLNTTGEGPASLSLWRILYCHLSGLSFGEITTKTLEGANKKKVKSLLQFRNLVQPQIRWHKPPFTGRGLKTEKNPSGCSQGLTTDSGGEVKVLKGVSVETDFAFCWLHKPDNHSLWHWARNFIHTSCQFLLCMIVLVACSWVSCWCHLICAVLLEAFCWKLIF